jgi:peptidoglycan/xylan/chitin deacetylase (PgdA/CDA1 family)
MRKRGRVRPGRLIALVSSLVAGGMAAKVTAAAQLRPLAMVRVLTTTVGRSPGTPALRLALQAGRSFAQGTLPIRPEPALKGVAEIDGKNARHKNLVAFTFDDGPQVPYTTRVLDLLKRHHIPATFFVVGYHLTGPSARDHAALVARELAEGHQVGTHTFRHERLEHATRAAAWSTLRANEAVLAPVLGRRPNLFRPPYGRLSPEVRALVGRIGYTIVLWSIDVRDFAASSSAEVSDQVIATLFEDEGGLVLLHDTHPYSVAALPAIFAALDRENCRRVARGRQAILPVPLDLLPGAAPPAVQAPRIAKLRADLAARCAARAAH